jgi:flagellar basal body-associated protein FliL
MSEPTGTPAPPAAGGGWKKTVGVVLITGLAAAGGGFWWSRSTAAQEGVAEHAPKAVKATRGLVKFEPFVVNLADGAGTRFLRTTLQLVIEPSEGAAALAENPVKMLELRSAVLELLAQQSASALVTPEGKAAMKAAIISRAQEALEDWKIADVLFSEFVVQF